MVYIGYFLLLLFCIPTNMIHSMDDFRDLTQNEPNLQIQEGTYDSWKWDSINFNETSDSFNFSLDSIETFSGSDDTSSESEFFDRECFITFEERFSFSSLSNFLKKSSSSLDVFSGRSFITNRSSCPQQQPEARNLPISSSSARQFFLPSENDFMDLTQQTFDFGIDKNIDVLQQISSHSKQQKNTNCHSQKPSTENFETALQQSVLQSLLPIDSQLSNRTESLMSSDVEDSTVFDPEFDDQEIFISEQPLRKKRRVNKEDVPDDAYFTIVCDYCSHKQQFKTILKHDLIKSFKNHVKNKHSDKTEKETKSYIKEHLRRPELFLQFSIHCSESGCKYIAYSVYRWNLKTLLSSHISKKHQKNKGNDSIESVEAYVEDNWKKIFVPVQKQLKNGNFTIVCDYCPLKPQFQAQIKGNLIKKFKKHLRNVHLKITEGQVQIYIKEHLRQPEQFVKFSVHCPESKCQDILCSSCKRDLKEKLFSHMSNQHKKETDYIKDELSIYVKKNFKRIFVPNTGAIKKDKKKRKFLQQPKADNLSISSSSKQWPRKKREINKKDVPDNAYFTIFCIGCSGQFRSVIKKYVTKGFKGHLKREHQKITEGQAQIYIKEHLRQPELLIRFLVHCPEPECKHIACISSQRSDLKKNLFDHISTKHPKNKDNYPRELVEIYVEKNYTTAFVKQFNKKDVPDNAYFTIPCIYGSCRPQFKTLLKNNLVSSFKRHLEEKHPDVIPEQVQIYIDQNLHEPKQFVKFSIHCPESECEHITCSFVKGRLKEHLFNHISVKHPKNKNNYSIESVKAYAKDNCERILVSATRAIKKDKKKRKFLQQPKADSLSISSSSSTGQSSLPTKNTNYHFQQPSTKSFETAPQQSISQSLLPTNLQLSNRAELSMSSDVENSTVQLFSKQPPRKKKRN